MNKIKNGQELGEINEEGNHFNLAFEAKDTWF